MKIFINQIVLISSLFILALSSSAIARDGGNNGNRGGGGNSCTTRSVPYQQTEYYTVFVPSKMVCPGNNNNFADFSSGCSYSKAFNDRRSRTVTKYRSVKSCPGGGGGRDDRAGGPGQGN